MPFPPASPCRGAACRAPDWLTAPRDQVLLPAEPGIFMTPEQYDVLRRHGTEAPYRSVTFADGEPHLVRDDLVGRSAGAASTDGTATNGTASLKRPARKQAGEKKDASHVSAPP